MQHLQKGLCSTNYQKCNWQKVIKIVYKSITQSLSKDGIQVIAKRHQDCTQAVLRSTLGERRSLSFVRWGGGGGIVTYSLPPPRDNEILTATHHCSVRKSLVHCSVDVNLSLLYKLIFPSSAINERQECVWRKARKLRIR